MLLQAAKGIRGTVYDLETGRRVPKVIELNEERGYVKAYFVVRQDDEHPDREVIRRNLEEDAEWYEAHGRFKFVPNASLSNGLPSRKVLLGSPNCARCRSPLTLPGDDLCPRCRAQDRLQRNRFLIERLTTPLLDRKCESCSRLATWAVADEVEVTPELSRDALNQYSKVLWERGMTVWRRYYCDRCYQPARLLDDKGEVVKDFRYAGPDTVKRA